MSKKEKTTNTVAWSPNPGSPDIDALRTQANKSVDYSTPVRNAYARAKSNLDRSYTNPLGAYTTAGVRDAAKRTQTSDLNQSMGLDLSNAAQQNSAGQYARYSDIAHLTAPQMYNSGGTRTTSDPMGAIMGFGQMGTSLATSALGGKA
jgi:hypothetical protein